MQLRSHSAMAIGWQVGSIAEIETLEEPEYGRCPAFEGRLQIPNPPIKTRILTTTEQHNDENTASFSLFRCGSFFSFPGQYWHFLTLPFSGPQEKRLKRFFCTRPLALARGFVNNGA